MLQLPPVGLDFFQTAGLLAAIVLFLVGLVIAVGGFGTHRLIVWGLGFLTGWAIASTLLVNPLLFIIAGIILGLIGGWVAHQLDKITPPIAGFALTFFFTLPASNWAIAAILGVVGAIFAWYSYVFFILSYTSLIGATLVAFSILIASDVETDALPLIVGGLFILSIGFQLYWARIHDVSLTSGYRSVMEDYYEMVDEDVSQGDSGEIEESPPEPAESIQKVINEAENELLVAVSGNSAFVVTDQRLIFNRRGEISDFALGEIIEVKIRNRRGEDFADGVKISVSTHAETFYFESGDRVEAVVKGSDSESHRTIEWDMVIDSVESLLHTLGINANVIPS